MIGVEITPEIRDMLDMIERIAGEHSMCKLQDIKVDGIYSTSMESLNHLYHGSQYKRDGFYVKYDVAKINDPSVKFNAAKTNDPTELVQIPQ
jgi:hypothetical protein